MIKLVSIVIGLIISLSACVAPSTKRLKVDPVLAVQEEKKQKEVAFKAYIKDYKRVLATGYKIKRYSSPLCPDKIGFGKGFLLANKFSFNENFQKTAEAVLGLGDIVKVIQVFVDSGGMRSGIQLGDLILEINGQRTPKGSQAIRDISEKMNELWKKKKGINLKILREGRKQMISLQMDKICDFPINISENDAINAFADGNRIVITRGMLRFAQDDRELALIIGHELAHNVMGHIDSKMINAIPGFLLDLAAGFLGGINTQGLFSKISANAYSQEFEIEADYVGMYMMARAGLNLDGAPNFWRRMASIHPGSIENNLIASHPATPERFLTLEQTVVEIKEKLAQGKPLIPEKTEKTFWEFLRGEEDKEGAVSTSK